MGGVDSRDGAAIVVVILFVCVVFFTSVQMWVFGDRQIRVVQGGLPGMTTYLEGGILQRTPGRVSAGLRLRPKGHQLTE